MNQQASHALFNVDCVEGAKIHLPDSSVDLFVSEPPYSIEMMRKSGTSARGHASADGCSSATINQEYAEFTNRWIEQADRVVRPGGSIYVICDTANLRLVLVALRNTSLVEVNHIIWRDGRGVSGKEKFIAVHRHILLYVKHGARHTFNTFSRFATTERDARGRSRNYQDREDVWLIEQESTPTESRIPNSLPEELLTKIISYSSNEGDLVCDFFQGTFSTARVAKGMNRKFTGFEVDSDLFNTYENSVSQMKTGHLLERLKDNQYGLKFE